ncbi:hypothetical protein C4Y57_022905 [Klebsiella variicola]|uniref:Uncharacterized protein n=1 Tax=Klebsiella variicola TaxID=244366 RepID=A0A2N4YXR7_KLEVA|nr:hypothetical protein [Klebsiella variicola]MBX4742989.1 hypothetical protein [Klebsiella pneumoniae]MBZ6783105.1 hypothetical protein [Klebsiella variicola]MBZ7511343.1 hypothetical protein [Klebsiella pneumoniae]PLM92676.1 hypothetical protein CWN47_21100 [Klebsiella variicola]
MVSLRLSSRERLAKDTTSSISNSSSLHLPENAGAALTSPSPWWRWRKALSPHTGSLFCQLHVARK